MIVTTVQLAPQRGFSERLQHLDTHSYLVGYHSYHCPLFRNPQLPPFEKWQSMQRKKPWLSLTGLQWKTGKDSSRLLLNQIDWLPPVHTKESQPNQNWLSIGDTLSPRVSQDLLIHLTLSIFVTDCLFLNSEKAAKKRKCQRAKPALGSVSI